MPEIALRFKSWQALLTFGLVACPVPFLGATLRDRCAHLACTIGLEERSGFELT